MILVMGATGTNGREVATRLAAAGHRVRALVRDPGRAAGLTNERIELVAGDLDDSASLARAFEGTDKAFLVTPVDRRHVAWFRQVVSTARAAGTAHLVKLSALGAQPDSPSELLRQHAESDTLISASEMAWTILRPNSFHQNLLWSAATIKSQSSFFFPLKDARLSLVDVRDIADVAVAALTQPGHEGKIYDITGPQSLSFGDIAATLSQVLGKPIRYLDVPVEAAEASMRDAGMPEWDAHAVVELYGYFATGAAAGVTGTVETILGRPPISFAQFAREHASAFQ
jgi:uncharacterized protein YbjT (DUF2867 family)